MSLKYKIIAFNTLIFLIIFDAIYLLVWIPSVHMNPVKALIVAGIAGMLTPWVKASEPGSGQKVVIWSYLYAWYNKYLKK